MGTLKCPMNRRNAAAGHRLGGRRAPGPRHRPRGLGPLPVAVPVLHGRRLGLLRLVRQRAGPLRRLFRVPACRRPLLPVRQEDLFAEQAGPPVLAQVQRDVVAVARSPQFLRPAQTCPRVSSWSSLAPRLRPSSQWVAAIAGDGSSANRSQIGVRAACCNQRPTPTTNHEVATMVDLGRGTHLRPLGSPTPPPRFTSAPFPAARLGAIIESTAP